ncbi:MAG TPA: 4'-phosphopantetheinyl transferase superfamily protein [Rhodanobacteraceae bacterium]
MIGPEDFIAASPPRAAPQLGDDVHLWRLPYARGVGRTPLLALLAAYTANDAAALELRDDEHGKPQLFAHGEPHRELQFNWSHSGALALVALARSAIPGVDIEQPREGVKILEIARRFFAPAEADALAACGGAEREALFFRLWCAKEAVLKALGRGLAFGLERVAFERDGEGWQPCRFDPEAGSPAEWQVHPLVPVSGCAGAVAWRGPARAIRAWREDGH